MTRTILTVLVLLAAAALPKGVGSASSQPLPGPIQVRRHVPLPPPLPVALATLVEAIHQQESSGGRNCVRGKAGEVGCYQILPSTARRHGCTGYSRACAVRIVQAGIDRCGLAVMWVAHYYNTGKCGPRPGRYAQDVQRRWMAAMIRAQRGYRRITLVMR